MLVFNIPVVYPRSWTGTLLLVMVGVFGFVGQVSARVTWVCPLVICHSPDFFDDGASARNCIAWFHWTVCPGAFCCGARRHILGSYTILIVGHRRHYHYVLRYLRRCEWPSSYHPLKTLHVHSTTGSWKSKSRRKQHITKWSK
jgi:hypothetical protein